MNADEVAGADEVKVNGEDEEPNGVVGDEVDDVAGVNMVEVEVEEPNTEPKIEEVVD